MCKKFTVDLLLLIILAANGVMAQYDYLTVSDPQQPWYSSNGTIEEAIISVKPEGIYSQVDMYLTFSARGSNFSNSSQLEVLLNFELPEGSFVTDLWLWIGDDISKGLILDTWTASSIYESIVNRRRDPAILFKRSSKNYELRVYPLVMPGTRKIKLTYFVPNRWLASNVSVPLPLDILKTSMIQIPVVKVITWEKKDWVNPVIDGASGTFTAQYDTLFGNYYALAIPDYSNLSSLSLDFNNPMVNGLYVKFYKNLTEGYYQLSLFPGDSVATENKKVLFLIDYDTRKSSITREQVTDNIKLLLSKYFAQGDLFNIFYSGLDIGKVSDDWISVNPADIEQTFQSFNSNSISIYSNLPTLLREGYEYCINSGGDSYVYLISNSDQVGSYYQSANQLILDIKNLLTVNIPTYILDFNDREYQYYYWDSKYYLGNEYFYENLSRITGGMFERMSSSFENSLIDIFQNMSRPINSFDLYTSLQNGFCFSRQTLSGENEVVRLNKAITQVGKFIGDLPFIIKMSGIYKEGPVTETRTIAEDSSLISDDVTQKMWANAYMNSLERNASDNSTINEVIDYSLSNNILSTFTAFLCLENDSIVYCKDCYDGSGDLPVTSVDDKEEVPTKFSLTAFPNPFNSQVNITVTLPQDIKAEELSFKIYNILGQVVKTFDLKDASSSNIIELRWDGKNDSGETASSGVYVFMVAGKDFKHSLKLMFLK